jgi:hypothetical protein
MMYACSIWSNASIKGRVYIKKTLSILQSIQARAARTICGAFEATSRAALDVEAFLLPIAQQIWKRDADVVTRLLSSIDTASTAGFQRDTTPPATKRAGMDAQVENRDQRPSDLQTYTDALQKGTPVS